MMINQKLGPCAPFFIVLKKNIKKYLTRIIKFCIFATYLIKKKEKFDENNEQHIISP
jgi:hypothetical protein